MDKRIFIKEIKKLFIDFNKSEKRYSQVWLSEIDYGGLYYSDKYILNVKMEHHIDSIIQEITYVIDFVRKNLSKEIFSYMYSVSIHNDDERIWHEKEDIILYDDVFSEVN